MSISRYNPYVTLECTVTFREGCTPVPLRITALSLFGDPKNHHLGWAPVKDGRFVLPSVGPGGFILSIYTASDSDPMIAERTIRPELVRLGGQNVSDGFEGLSASHELV
jgi:hypothetical protein